jgi:gluconokinase
MTTCRGASDLQAAEAAAAKTVPPVVLMGVSGSEKSTAGSNCTRAGPAVPGRRRPAPAGQCRKDAVWPPARRHRSAALAACGRALDKRARDGIPTRHHHLLHPEARLSAHHGRRRPGVRPVYLKGDEPLIQERIVYRHHRYMPPRLLRSQFETLQEPGEGEHPVFVTIRAPWPETVTDLLRRLIYPRHVSAVFVLAMSAMGLGCVDADIFPWPQATCDGPAAKAERLLFLG